MTQYPTFELSSLRAKPRILEWLPGTGNGTAQALYPYVYLPRSIYQDLHSSQPNPYNVALVMHEQEHMARAKTKGILRWYMQYICSRKFRLSEELAAMQPQLAYLKRNNLTLDLERKARLLSGRLYLWSGDYATILNQLNEI